jgi:radical SAM superfamily enzyme YgiQ (UPF0313 family)
VSELFLFVRPPRPLWPFIGPSTNFWPPLAFASLAAALRESVPDLRVAILDAPILKMGWRSLEGELRRLAPAYVGIGEEAVSCLEGLRLARLAKAGGARVIAGGCFFGHVAPQLLATGLVDVVVHGEGEQTVVELVQALRSGSTDDLRRVRGISFSPEAWETSDPTSGAHCGLEPSNAQLSTLNAQHSMGATPGKLNVERWVLNVERCRSWAASTGSSQPIGGVSPAEVVFTGHRPLIPDLDRLPFPAYDLLPMDRYGADSRNHPRFGALELGRGCLEACSFCVLWRQMGHFQDSRVTPRLRTKSAERLIAEVRVLVRGFHRCYLGWVDPCFNAHPQVPGQLAERMLREDLRPGQSAWIRADGVLRDEASGALGTCVAAGLNEVYLGIERPDTAGLEALHKRESLGQCRRALELLASRYAQVFTVGSFIYGLPGDTPDVVRRIYRLSLELRLDKTFFIPLTPLPGTPFWQPELWDASGRRFRGFDFLPRPPVVSPTPELERALVRCAARDWRPARLLAYARGLFGGTARKRRLTWRLGVRSTGFILHLIRQTLVRDHQAGGMRVPEWYER